MKYLFAVLIITGIINSCIKDSASSGSGSRPEADFFVMPASGPTTTLFKFNAWRSSDPAEANSFLEVRWDWNNDGSWDTDFSAAKTSAHQYADEGLKTVKMEVKNSAGLKDICSKQILVEGTSGTGTVTDVEGYVYQTIKIGSQWWTAENLQTTKYRSGETIENGRIWAYDNDEINAVIYGRLYSWHAVSDVRGIAPAGWHIPSDEEWQTLVEYLGGSLTAGGRMKTTGTIDVGTGLWSSPNNCLPEESGFAALPAGYRVLTGSFRSLNASAGFWSTASDRSGYAWLKFLRYGTTTVSSLEYDWN